MKLLGRGSTPIGDWMGSLARYCSSVFELVLWPLVFRSKLRWDRSQGVILIFNAGRWPRVGAS